MKTKIKNNKIESNPIVISASVTNEKLAAIVNLSQAVLHLAQSLNSVHTSVSINNCQITNAKKSAIEIHD